MGPGGQFNEDWRNYSKEGLDESSQGGRGGLQNSRGGHRGNSMGRESSGPPPNRATGTPANPDDWPKSLRDYVTRCFASCTTDQEKDAAEVFLKNRLKTSETDGDFIWNTDWDNEPTPFG